MTNIRAIAAFERAELAFKNPTLSLLHRRRAPFIVGTLSLIFTGDRSEVAVSDMHVEVGAIAEELRAAGYDEGTQRVSNGTGRDICRRWVQMGWLQPQIVEGVEVYRLSAQAVGALEIAGRAGGGRAKVSRSRVRTLLESVDQLAQSAETDLEKRLERLRAERDALNDEIALLESDEFDLAPVDDDQLLEEAENVLHLSRELPADFMRVAESINAMQRDVIAELRRDERPTGEVLREYLRRGEHVMDSTPEGRAFAGALKLIGDPEHIDYLTEQLHGLLSQPFARHMPWAQRSELQAIAKRVEQGVQEVLVAQRRASHVITTQVRTHDPIRDREIDDLLRGVMSGLQSWVPGARSNDTVDPLRSLPTAEVQHLRQSVSDIRPPRVPAPLKPADLHAEFIDADTRAWGGPNYLELEEHIAGIEADEFDLAETFASIEDADIRRPADLLGLLEIAHRHGITEGDTVSVATAVRPDGTHRSFAFGAVIARTVPGENSRMPASQDDETNTPAGRARGTRTGSPVRVDANVPESSPESASTNSSTITPKNTAGEDPA